MLQIQDLVVVKEGKQILKGLTFEVLAGQVSAIMGPNGAGKSTLARVLAGDPTYEVVEGDILLNGESILELEPDQRAHLGLFMSFQYPIEIPGVSNEQFLRVALNAKRKAQGIALLSQEEFSIFLRNKMEITQIRPEFALRNVNEGFSGGEKKRNEILQMAVLDPCFAVLDETDSGLDIDALKIVANGVSSWMSAEKGLVLITHYPRLLELIVPDQVHVLLDGKIVASGPASFAKQLEERGYDWLRVAK